jgi:TRAP-type uncharacterized transport system substrate-binding protein
VKLETPTTLTAAAGGAGGSWHVLLEGLATLVHEIQPGIVIAFDLARAHLDAGGPLHPGAERYFRDAGFLGSGSA